MTRQQVWAEHLQPALSLSFSPPTWVKGQARGGVGGSSGAGEPWSQRTEGALSQLLLLRHPTQPPAECRRRTRSFVFPPSEGSRLVSVVYDPARRYLQRRRCPRWQDGVKQAEPSSRPGLWSGPRPALGAEIGMQPGSCLLTPGGRKCCDCRQLAKVSEVVAALLLLQREQEVAVAASLAGYSSKVTLM